ncbi:DNA repair protein RadA [Candidatus Peregrinibacteria bacterium]|nr:DNA repair protein RadA [Candidatus Peregrinibacteria bacterium]
MKLKTIYICNSCQFESSKWLGQCPQCSQWNTFMEDVINVGKPEKGSLSKTPRSLKVGTQSPTSLENSGKNTATRLFSDIEEFDRVIGQGITPGSIILLSGEPGIGKSTLTLQIANNLAKKLKVLLVSGEESVEQIAGRAGRLNLNEKNLLALNEYNLENILATIRAEKPGLIIIDSIQVISSMDFPGAAGSITQVRYSTERLLEISKTTNTPVILIGHVTKDGTLAGPKVLEHLVDTVLLFEGDRFQQFRLLRAQKNRFGSCSEVGIFEMTENGLIEIKNPSEQFLEGRKQNAIGSAITVAMEGTRPFLVEVQSLVSTSAFGFPKRTANGFDLNRLQILIAVLEKYCKFNLQNQDVFINVVGGIKLSEPASDLAVLMAIASSYLKKPLPQTAAIFGEVGLSGELRKVIHHEKRQKEAEKMGFTQIISSGNHKEIQTALRILN